MSNQDNFTQEEWDTLTLAPVLIGVAVAHVSGQARNDTQRQMDLVNGVLQAPNEQANSTELIRSVIDGVLRRPPHDTDAAEASLEVGNVCRTVAVILQTKREDPASGLDANEIARFKDWLVAFGNQVAEAGRGKMGDETTNLLDEIASALNEITAAPAGNPAPAPDAEPGRDASPAETLTTQLTDAVPPDYAAEELRRRSIEASETKTPFD